jgi:hypothetical protein
MANPVNGDVLEVAMYVDLVGQLGVNVRHYVVSGVVGGGPSEKFIADELSLGISTRYVSWFNADTAFLGVKLQAISPTRRPAVTSTSGAINGAVVSDALPDQVAAVVKLRSGMVGRSKRGRMYLAGFTEADNTASNSVSAGTQLAISVLMTYMLQPISVTNAGAVAILNPVIFSRKLGTHVPIASYAIHTEWGTIRKRSQINRGDAFPVL